MRTQRFQPRHSTIDVQEHITNFSRKIKPLTRQFVHLSVYFWELRSDISQTRDRIIRAEGAQINGFENLGLFASAVVAANVAGLPAKTLNALCGGYLASRVVYNFIYINNTTETLGNLRTAVFLTGLGHIFTLFIKSGNILVNRAANVL